MRQLTSAERMDLGVHAARANLYGVARGHFMAVLRQDPTHIPALVWLAHVAPTPEESLRLLNQVLTLDPTNEQARTGIRRMWRQFGLAPANQRVSSLSGAGNQMAGQPASPAPAPRKRNVTAYYFLKSLLVMIVMGVLGITAGLGASGLGPPEILAGWLPAATLFPAEPAAEALQPPAESLQMATAAKAPPARNSIVAPIVVSPPAPASFGPDRAEIIQTSRRMLELNTLPQTVAPNTTLLIGSIKIDPVPPPAPAVSSSFQLPVDSRPVNPALLAHWPAYPGEKWIEVNVTTQQVTAWEGNVPVLKFLASTGLPETPTILGKFRIYWKLRKTDMFGFNYYVPEVPYAMYFQGDYALHGTYWHDNFGHRMSRGCVNLSIGAAKKLFEWAGPAISSGESAAWAGADNPGTLVVVHE